MSILDTILDNTRQEVARAKKTTPLERLKEVPHFVRQALSLHSALQGRDIAIIAEIKRASPSKGIILQEFNPLTIAKEYVAGGANGLSVLSDKKYFHGDIRFIAEIRSSVPVPILRKDFIIDPYQLVESKAFGADAVLLIAAALKPNQLKDLSLEAGELGLDCLVEVHNEQELNSIDLKDVKMIGINNRDLVSFTVDIMTTARVAAYIPPGITIVSESGISSRDDIDRLAAHGIHAVLVGESLMRAASPRKALEALRHPPQGQMR